MSKFIKQMNKYQKIQFGKICKADYYKQVKNQIIFYKLFNTYPVNLYKNTDLQRNFIEENKDRIEINR